jgi:aminopeptidase N
VKAEEVAHPKSEVAAVEAGSADNTLLNTNDELYLRGKSSFVFWMIRDMVGDTAMQAALAKYRPGADKDPSYLQRLIQTSSKRDLEWFFDDWVYRDRGLPDFHVATVYVRPLLSEANKNFLLTATIENRGHAGAEVPVLVQTPSGEKTIRVLVKAGAKDSGRIEVSVAPDKITVNDGSVPEANIGNNVYDVPPPSR